ncbi:MAG: transcription antitermination factor NusB [Gammaproteobacteria bacterium]|nr:transcription antitermination factor NusB [Gammaproteobacteria bacterium]MBM4209554.1 transcription antitermination factor NusB [Gammaproteobacteria bacterium]MBM4230594.1 transcription antitermination factor NusB [Gammaproteobacteria bacterium]
MSRAADPRSGARSVARKLAVQALYQWQLNEALWQDLLKDFSTEEDMARADREYFAEIVRAVVETRAALDTRLAAWVDRAPQDLDPVEHAVLLIGVYELAHRPDVPWRVVVNEAVGLTRRFGATDAHKYVNAVLDRAARELRPHEH